MKKIILAALIVLAFPGSANADWRWAKPDLKPHKVAVFCGSDSAVKCHRRAQRISKYQRREAIRKYNARKLREWNKWTRMAIPSCTWYGESGRGPEYHPVRYTMPNSGGSGAYGKFQFMSGTYHANAKYHDWSPLDQEIAARREYWKHGTGPWSNCH